jgi:hypothetical protein
MSSPSALAHRSPDGNYSVGVSSGTSLWISLPGDGSGCVPVALPVQISGAVGAAGQSTVTVTKGGHRIHPWAPDVHLLRVTVRLQNLMSSLTVTITENP